jgi:translation elongation factor EF-Ts
MLLKKRAKCNPLTNWIMIMWVYIIERRIIMNLIDKVNAKSVRNDIPEFRVGDTVRVDVKIIEGKVNKYFSESVLFAQEYLLNPDLKVEQAIKNEGATLVKFVRYQVGEGIQKREENFAEEVAKQMA